MVNKETKRDEYLRCSATEMWEHVVQYEEKAQFRKNFIIDLI